MQQNWWENDAPVSQAGGAPASGIQIKPAKAPEPEKPRDPPSGYNWGPNGSLVAIPGGPADPNAKPPAADKAPGVEQSKASGYLLRAQRANDAYSSLNVGPEPLLRSAAKAVLPDTAVNMFSSGKRQQADAYISDFIAATLRQESGAAIPPEEFDAQYRRYFPLPNEGPESVAAKAALRATALDALRLQAGSGAAAIPAGQPSAPAGQVVFNDQLPSEVRAPDEFKPTPEQDAALRLFYQTNKGFTPEQLNAFSQSIGLPATTPERAAEIAAYYAKGGTGYGGISNDPRQNAQYREQLRNENAAIDQAQGGRSDSLALAQQGSTQGLSDEISGVGGGLGALLMGNNPIEGYVHARDRERVRVNDARDNMGWVGTGVELGSSLALPLGSVTGVKSAAKLGAMGGGIAGFGYGDGSQSVQNALFGAAGGAAVGKGLEMGGRGVNALLNTSGRQASRAESTTNALAVANAGRAERVPVSRALVDPSLENRVTGAQSTVAGGPVVDRSLAATSDAIGAGIQRLGGQGDVLAPPVAGGKVTDAAVRWIKQSGSKARRLYDRAETLAGDAKVSPAQSLAQVDDMIRNLSETSSTNQAEIAFLNGLKQDLSKDLSVAGLRRIRTNLRKRISKGELIFGEDEARVLGIMDAASSDIEAGLQGAGKAEAARAFKAADQNYRQRMDYIQNTIQRVVGKRNANLSGEKVFANLQAMTGKKGDVEGFGRIMKALDPEEQADIAATFADGLGKNPKGEFSTAHLLSQADKLPREARLALFGEEGAQSLENLLRVAKEHNRVYSRLNHSRSGVAVNSARDWRSWLAGAIGIGAGATSNTVTGVATGAAAGAAVLAKDALSARALMSRDIAKWIGEAPRTTDPKAIDTHFRKLASIAARNPALAGEVERLQQAIWRAANDNMTTATLRSAASSTPGGDERKPDDKSQNR